MIYGLSAAVGWGVADFVAALISRRFGTLRTLAVAQIAGVTGQLVILVVFHPPIGHPTVPAVAALAGGGVLAALAYFGLYRGLAMGPVTLVSPIVAGYSAITIGMAVPLLHEALPAAGWLGASITLTGAALASTDLRQLGRGRRPRTDERTGVPFAFLAMVTFGVATFVIGYYSKSLGWFFPALVSRATTTVVLVAALAVRGERDPGTVRPGAGGLSIAVLLGIVDVAALAAYARGTEIGLVTIVAAASATYPMIPVFGGVLFLGERPAANQALGVALVVGGLLLLGLHS